MKVYAQRAALSASHTHWRTPPDIYGELDREFDFNFDPCPIGGSLGLTQSWQAKRVFCNPPYKGIAAWVAKWQEADLAVYLLPSRTDTDWFHRCLSEAREIRFIRGRLRFGNGPHNAPFPSCIVVFKP